MCLRTVGSADRALLRWVAARRGRGIDAVAVAASQLGKGGVLPVAAFAWQRRRDASAGASVAAAGKSALGAFLLSVLLSRALKRRRPCAQGLVEPLTRCPRGPSLPSDQAAAAAAVLALGLRADRHLSLRLVPLVGLVCYSRVHVGAHYPSDVLAGAVVGAAWTEFVSRVARREA